MTVKLTETSTLTETEKATQIASERPSVLMRPSLTLVASALSAQAEKDQTPQQHWRVAYGALEVFGRSPGEAMAAFDECWYTQLTDRNQLPIKAVG